MSMGVLSREPLDLQSLIAQVAAPERGGVATFLGLVRNHQDGRTVVDLEYSSYEPMAEAVCADIIAEVEQRWQVKLAIQHRLGRLEIGEAAVAVAAAGAHREEAFAACRYAIEELKRRVPIWKRERFADGTVEWVDPAAGSRQPAAGNGSST